MMCIFLIKSTKVQEILFQRRIYLCLLLSLLLMCIMESKRERFSQEKLKRRLWCCIKFCQGLINDMYFCEIINIRLIFEIILHSKTHIIISSSFIFIIIASLRDQLYLFFLGDNARCSSGLGLLSFKTTELYSIIIYFFSILSFIFF